jgi:hypothetical protein
MTDEPPISDLLSQWKSGDDDAARQIVEHFWRRAHSLSSHLLPPNVRQSVSGSDIANDAFRSALSYFKNSPSEAPDRDEFWGLVVLSIQRKRASAIRKAKAKRRDVDRSKEYVEQPQPHSASPQDQVMAEELAERAFSIVNSEAVPMWRLIGLLGIFHDFSARQILEVVAAEFSKEGLPSISAIHVYLQDLRATLKEKVFGDLDDRDE